MTKPPIPFREHLTPDELHGYDTAIEELLLLHRRIRILEDRKKALANRGRARWRYANIPNYRAQAVARVKAYKRAQRAQP